MEDIQSIIWLRSRLMSTYKAVRTCIEYFEKVYASYENDNVKEFIAFLLIMYQGCISWNY